MHINTEITHVDSMKIGIAGGTGGMGEGFALRWCQKHDVIVGSRDAQKAREAAENYMRAANQTYSNITGSIVVSPIVPMARTETGFVYIPLEEEDKEQAAEMVADKLPPRSRVVSAFHTISESKLKNLQQSLDADTFICGDDQNVIAKLTGLINEIAGLRPVYLGPLALTYQAEILTPMCLNAAKRNKMKNPGVKLV